MTVISNDYGDNWENAEEKTKVKDQRMARPQPARPADRGDQRPRRPGERADLTVREILRVLVKARASHSSGRDSWLTVRTSFRV
jgi:hypothetical protein